MQSGICHVTAAHRLVPAVYIHVVPVTVMRLPVLPGPAGIGVLPRSFGGCAGPVLRDLAVPDGPVLIAGIVIARHRDNGRIQDLSAPGDIAPAGQKTVEAGKQALDRPRLRKSLAIEPDRLRIRDTILKAQPGKPHERKAVAHLIFDPVVRQVIKRARDRRPEHRYRVHRLAPRPGFALRIPLAPGPFKGRAKFLLRHNSVDLDQADRAWRPGSRNGLKDQKNHLRHRLAPIPGRYPKYNTAPETGQFLEAPLRK